VATPAARPTPAPPLGRLSAAEAAAARDVVYRQLSRIYSAMKPVEAAEVLSHLGEEDVIGILSKFGARQAAQILGAMPRERAAALSQRLLLDSGAPQGSR
jgi:flagellar motility protein MotE (MotC chaperone)